MSWYASLDDTLDVPLKRAVASSERNHHWRAAKRYAWLVCPVIDAAHHVASFTVA
jgi:hypothetical protein